MSVHRRAGRVRVASEWVGRPRKAKYISRRCLLLMQMYSPKVYLRQLGLAASLCRPQMYCEHEFGDLVPLVVSLLAEQRISGLPVHGRSLVDLTILTSALPKRFSFGGI